MFTDEAPEGLHDDEELIHHSIREDALYDLPGTTPALIAMTREQEEADPIPRMSALDIEARLLHLASRREALELALIEAEKRERASAQAARGPHGSAAISRFLLDAEERGAA